MNPRPLPYQGSALPLSYISFRCTKEPSAEASLVQPLLREEDMVLLPGLPAPFTASSSERVRFVVGGYRSLRGLRPSPFELCVQVLFAPSKLGRPHQQHTARDLNPFRQLRLPGVFHPCISPCGPMRCWWSRRALPPRPTRFSLFGSAPNVSIRRVQPSFFLSEQEELI